jgi:leucyl-tRNA synthetase
VSEEDLPVDLPHLDDYKPHGRPEPPLGKAPADWLFPEINGKRYRRETNTMPQWAGSCWYYLRFIDPKNSQAMVDAEKEAAWMPVDLYVGGAEHAVLHLLYARFWHKVLFDRGYVSTKEPFQRLVNQGMVLGEPQYHVSPELFAQNEQRFADLGIVGTRVEDKGNETWILRNRVEGSEEATDLTEEQTEKKKGTVYFADTEIPITPKSEKMSKSRGNVVNPDEIVQDYGADALRLYEMFMGPLEVSAPWSMKGLNGIRGFLDRVWRMIVDERSEDLVLNAAVQDIEPTDEQARVLHKTVKVVTHDLERMEFNTAIARMMEFVNFFTKEAARPKSAMKQLVLLLSPYAPHLCEELWQLLGAEDTLAYESWPTYDEALTIDEMIEIPISINGKVRGRIGVPADISKEDLEASATSDAKIVELIAGKEVKKVIVVPGRMVNLVVK